MIAALLIGREGSLGFPDKNVLPIMGRPMMVYPILAASASRYVDEIYVSTDSERIARIAEAHGAAVIERPAQLATKEALGEDVFVHGYRHLVDNLGKDIELMVLLFCNAPTVTAEAIDEGIEILRQNPEFDSAVSVSKYNMWSPLRARRECEDGLLHPFVPFETFGDPSTLNCDRDSQGDVWFADMGVSVVRPRCLEHLDSGLLPQKWMGQKIYPLKQWGGCDVDYEWQVPGVDFWLRHHRSQDETSAVRPRAHLAEIYRVPGEDFNRLDFTRLDKNENLVGLPQAIIDQALAAVSPEWLSTYPPTYQLYRKISEHLGIERKKLVVTAGTDAAIKMAFEAFVDPGDQVVFPDPTFAMVGVYARLFQAEAKAIPYDDRLRLPLEQFIGAIGPRTKLVVIANPDSPTGNLLDERDIRRIAERAADHRAAVLVDEAYYYFSEATMIDLIDDYENLLVTRSFSKALGLAAVRLGFAAGGADIIKAMTAWRPMYEVNSFAVLFGLAVLDHPEWLEEVRAQTAAGLAVIETAVAELGLRTFPVHANFIHIEVGAGRTASVVKAFNRAGMLVRADFSHPTLAGCVRLSLGPPDRMAEAAEVLREML